MFDASFLILKSLHSPEPSGFAAIDDSTSVVRYNRPVDRYWGSTTDAIVV